MIFPGLKTQEAAEALSNYLDQADIKKPEDRISALCRHYPVTWRDMLAQAGYTQFDIFDIHDAREQLLAQLRRQFEVEW